MRQAIVIAVLLVAGCTHASVQMSSGGGVSTTTGGAYIDYSGHGSDALLVLIGLGLIAAEYAGSAAARERGLEPERKPARPMDPSRRVNEVDCTKPIRDWSANLKCR